jgi:hypothetical protein
MNSPIVAPGPLGGEFDGVPMHDDHRRNVAFAEMGWSTPSDPATMVRPKTIADNSYTHIGARQYPS